MKEIRRGFKPFSLVYLTAGLVHRAVANNSGYDRKMLCIMLTNDLHYFFGRKRNGAGGVMLGKEAIRVDRSRTNQSINSLWTVGGNFRERGHYIVCTCPGVDT